MAMAAEGTLWVRVVDEANNVLPGACFEVYVDAGGGVRGDFRGGVCDHEDSSSNVSDGVVVVRQPAGNYVLAQTAAREGYELAPDQPVAIVDSAVTETVVINRPTAIPTPPGAEATATPSPTAAAAGETIDANFDVGGGRTLHLTCTGSAAPTVILEAGGPGFDSTSWATIQPSIAGIARTCSYDRAFLGKSDPAGDGPRTIADSVDDLHALIGAAGIACPCVFVGTSWGGPIIRLYAGTFPEDVKGLVFVDGVPPGFVDRFLELVPNDAPEPALVERDRLLGSNNPERVNQFDSLRLADAASPPVGVPASVLSHGRELGFDPSLPVQELEAAWKAAQAAHADQLNARLIPAEKSGGDPVREQPDLVISAITYVLKVVQSPPEESVGRIQVRAMTAAGEPLRGACFQIYVDAGGGTFTDDGYLNGACDGDDQVEDGLVMFVVTPGRYVIENHQPPPGYLPAPHQPARVPPADLTEVNIVYQSEAATPVA
jgi:pimeloyl-ACP methyl ester carboxylesterase